MGEWFNEILGVVEAELGSCEVTHRALVLGDRDGVTGHRARTWDSAPINMVVVTQDAIDLMVKVGGYVRLDGLGVTDTEVEECDEIMEADGTYWEVKTVKPRKAGITILCYECDLTELSLHD